MLIDFCFAFFNSQAIARIRVNWFYFLNRIFLFFNEMAIAFNSSSVKISVYEILRLLISVSAAFCVFKKPSSKFLHNLCSRAILPSISSFVSVVLPLKNTKNYFEPTK
jgi:hypothetical protein